LKLSILIAFALTANLAAASSTHSSGPNPIGASESSGAKFKILSSDGMRTIGSTRFTVLRKNSIEEIQGETEYLDGERDSEDVRLEVEDGVAMPRLDSYEHRFFNADGSIRMIDALDARTGAASCASYASGTMKLRKSRLEVPADSFAGAAGPMMVVASLRRGIREVRFHAFACTPGPSIFSVEALARRSEHWPLYRGDLVRVDMRPDLGALSILLAPFMPKMDAWFDPDDNWNYVGGEFDRYFRGPHVMTVRIAAQDAD
jgi:hypothetical protein